MKLEAEIPKSRPNLVYNTVTTNTYQDTADRQAGLPSYDSQLDGYTPITAKIDDLPSRSTGKADLKTDSPDTSEELPLSQPMFSVIID